MERPIGIGANELHLLRRRGLPATPVGCPICIERPDAGAGKSRLRIKITLESHWQVTEPRDPLTLRLSKGPDALLVDLRASRERLLAVLAGVSEEQFKRRPPVESVPIAGDWSIAEALAHLLAGEQRCCVRLEALVAGDPAPAAETQTDDERNTEARQGRSVPVPQLIHGLLAARRRLERALAQAGDATPDDVAILVRRDVIEHEQEHTDQIEAIKAVLPPRGSAAAT